MTNREASRLCSSQSETVLTFGLEARSRVDRLSIRWPNGRMETVRSWAVDPASPQTVYAGTWCGVFKSADGGETWTAVCAELATSRVVSLAVDLSTPQTLYVGTYGRGVFKSADREKSGPRADE